MAVYNINGNQLTQVYDATGSLLSQAFDIDLHVVYQSGDVPWEDEITVQKLRDNNASTNYYVATIPQTRTNGQKQYPFVYVPNGANGGTMSTLIMMQNTDFYMGMNAGYFDYSQTASFKPYGITIENGVLIREATEQYFLSNYTLTIDADGVLGYADTMASGVTAQDILNGGAISAVLGLVPLVVNGQASGVESTWWTSTERMQRQIIGQYANGDYCIITCEGRNFDDSQGFTVTETQNLCISMGLTFAMMLDGGGSTEKVSVPLKTMYVGTILPVVPNA